jgi:cysteinyl-tRNA synthetase
MTYDITITNSRTGRKELFQPADPDRVRMYVCGPTVYDRAHIGNARSAVVFDMVFRLLRHRYGSDRVRYARNFTDIDDKIIQRAQDSGESIHWITDRTIGWYHQDMDSLNVLRPTYEPRATEHIDDMVGFVKRLLDFGHAYEIQGHVMFRVTSFNRYGQFSGRRLAQNQDHPELGAIKEHPADFVLWKPSDDHTPGWESPWGAGRPGWHIECSAMAHRTLEHVDIHGGGLDLRFPHHENEIAQSECATGHEFGRYWMHNEMVTVEGRKMSKSLGNTITANQLLKRRSGLAIRYMLLGTHYRKPLDFTEERMALAQSEIDRWMPRVAQVDDGDVVPELIENLSNDFNTPGAIAVLRGLYRDNRDSELRAGMRLMGLI